MLHLYFFMRPKTYIKCDIKTKTQTNDANVHILVASCPFFGMVKNRCKKYCSTKYVQHKTLKLKTPHLKYSKFPPLSSCPGLKILPLSSFQGLKIWPLISFYNQKFGPTCPSKLPKFHPSLLFLMTENQATIPCVSWLVLMSEIRLISSFKRPKFGLSCNSFNVRKFGPSSPLND